MPERLRAVLEELGLSLRDFAREIGISHSIIHDFLTGRTKSMSTGVLASIRERFQVSPLWLLTGEGEMFLQGPLLKPGDLPPGAEYLTDENTIVVRFYPGGVPASPPGYADETFELVRFPRWMVPHEQCYVLTVKGMSMVGSGINDGDQIVVDTSLEPMDGDIVVAFVDGECTLKHLRLEEDRAFLTPNGPGHDEISTAGKELQVDGVVIKVVSERQIPRGRGPKKGTDLPKLKHRSDQ